MQVKLNPSVTKKIFKSKIYDLSCWHGWEWKIKSYKRSLSSLINGLLGEMVE